MTQPPDGSVLPGPLPGADPTAAGRHRLAVGVVVGALVVVALVLAGWAAYAADSLRREARAAQLEASAVQEALSAGDLPAARAAVDRAQTALAAARAATFSPPVRALAAVLGPDGPVADLDRMVTAAGDLVTAAEGSVVAYAQATGESGGTGLFHDGVVDLAVVGAMSGTVDGVAGLLDGAVTQLDRVRGVLPATTVLADLRDRTLADVRPLQQTVRALSPALAGLPAALGDDGQTRYLVALLNPAELRTTGGAPLTVAVVAFEDGRLSIPIQGTFSRLRPGDEKHTWDRVAQPPFALVDSKPDRFPNASNHPDFALSGEDLLRAWEAYGLPPVDGVIALDMTAVEALLRVVGPVDSPFGPITADNVVQTLLIDAYADFGNEGREQRRQLNERLLDTVLQRLFSGQDIVAILREVLGTAPGRHVQVYVEDPGLEAAAREAGLDGSLRPVPGADRVAVYTTNTTGTKLDVFQYRLVDQVVRLSADGGAEVTRTLALRNDAQPFDPSQQQAKPDPSRDDADGLFYEDRNARSKIFVYVPDGAEVVSTDGSSWPVNPRLWDDGVGGRTVVTVGTIAPQAGAQVVVTYRIPAGTFGSAGGPLAYRALLEPQALWRTPVVKLTVVPPAGYAPVLDSGAAAQGWAAAPDGAAVLQRVLDQRLEVTLAVDPVDGP